PPGPPGFDREIGIAHGTPRGPSWFPRTNMPTELLWSTVLENGETVWVVHYPSQAITADKLEESRRFVTGTRRGWAQQNATIDPTIHRLILEGLHHDGSSLWLDLATDFLAGAKVEQL